MPDLTGRTCLVTGATSGIGLETARGLATLGARVIVVGRHPERVAAARRAVEAAGPAAAHEALAADLGSQAAVRRLASTVRASCDRLDVLVNNAGVITRAREVTVDGLERQWAVNHLAPFLLTHLLRPLLAQAGQARVVNVASEVETLGRIQFDDVGFARHYDPNGAYCQSKLANVLFTFELARRLGGGPITANCLHPGAIATGLLAEYFGRPRSWATLARLKYPGAVRGATTSLYLASSPDVARVTGTYFVDCTPRESSPASRDRRLQQQVWAISETLAGLADSERIPEP